MKRLFILFGKTSFLQITVCAAVVPLVLVRFLPVTFAEPGAWLDEGWTAGINVAAAHHMAFGRDIIFTYGPYGAVATRLLDPALHGLIVGGGTILAVAFATGLLALALARPWVLIAVVFALPFVRSTDSLTFAMPLPAFLLCASIPKRGKVPARTLACVLTSLPALSLLPLIKGSGMIVSGLSLCLLVYLLWLAGQRRLAVALPVLAGLCVAILWLAAGQDIAFLPGYFINSIVIIAGYNEAMSTPGPWRDAASAAGLCSAMLALTAWGARRLPPAMSLPLCAVTAALLFLLFKAGFVRQDPGHEVITMSAVGLLFLLLAAWLGRVEALVAAATGLWLLVGPFAKPGLANIGTAWYVGASSEARGAMRLVRDPAGLAREFSDRMFKAPALPWHITGNADIYSAGQIRLFDSNFAWSPRPVFQSYAAYTPALEQTNLDRLMGADGAENIFFRPEPIDDRLPALEDGLSWPALLSLYDPVAYDSAEVLLWLRRAPSPRAVIRPGPAILSNDRALGETVQLPSGSQSLWASIDVQPTVAGRLAGMAWQAPLLHLTLNFADGRTETFRIIPGMARAGFLLSPFVASTIDFLRLRPSPDGTVARTRRPVAMRLEMPARGGWAWRLHYHVVVAPIAFPPVSVPLAVQNAGVPQPAALPGAGGVCYMDRVDGIVVPPNPPPTVWPIRLDGWAVFDAAGVPADRVDIGFQGADGVVFAAPAMPQMRVDIAALFHLPGADHGGFMAEVDLTHLAPGAYTVLAITHHGATARACRTSLTMTVAGTH